MDLVVIFRAEIDEWSIIDEGGFYSSKNDESKNRVSLRLYSFDAYALA